MKFIGATFVISSLLVASVSGAPAKLVRRGVDPNLVPQFGIQAGINPTGTGDCDGITNAAGQVVKIPCSCPPDRGSFIASLSGNVAAGEVVNNPSVKVSFPTDNSKASQLARIQTAIVTLQNLRGPGVGCPAASTTFLAQQKAVAAGPDTGSPAPAPAPASPAPAPASPAPAPESPAPAPAPAGGVDPNLVPQFGVQAGLNPTGTGDCDGIKNAAGQVVKIPCSCPPDRGSFIASLSANVAAGHAVNNPGVAVSFPSDNSKASQIARIQAAIVTLQNLRGPGVGCPAASTTFVAQQQAIAAGN
ncbi:hypothetical protein K443DRAFT_682493 [Laccaria amethystina LaAM-08-1]|uniref:Uncharacterized protein n=1 Tax=Laccaria amethystina LaAM-08-1 TaxID=1095629 RepID=A0A0C9WKB6_9AGAR|nr:hypothetical protein K443DRAFT_682493 [Laccaria amethystina LaAM-08-1]